MTTGPRGLKSFDGDARSPGDAFQPLGSTRNWASDTALTDIPRVRYDNRGHGASCSSKALRMESRGRDARN